MNFFKNLRTNYGQETIKIVRKAENTTRQLARHRNHLVFNLRCKGECAIPPSLRLKCPINSVKARNNVEKARKNLLRERIRLTNQTISHLQDKKRRLAERFPSDVQQQLNAHLYLTRVHESVHKQAKCRQQDKLASLISKSKKNNPSEPDLSGTQIKRWVVNLSKYKLNQDQTSVLSKGLNFAITPHRIPTNDIIVATELACKSLPTNEATQLRTEIVEAIKSSKVPKSNISKGEKMALRSLKQEDSIMILPADKGRATVVMDKTEYEEKVSTTLNDAHTYEKLQADPTSSYKRKLIEKLTKLKKDSKITEDQYNYLYPTSEATPRLYCTPEIHKGNNPVRPIVDYTGSIGYNVSRTLVDLLGPLVGTTEQHVKNSEELAEELS